MRNVPKSTRECIHWWAHQTRESARSGNVRFDGPVFYSYAQPVAILFPDNRVLISNYHWSMTTSSHQSMARHATHHMRCCHAPYIAQRMCDLNEMHEKNRKWWVNEAENALIDLKRHPGRKKSVADRIAAAVTSYNTYRAFFELDWPEMTSEEMKALVETTAELRAKEEEIRIAREADLKKQREIEEAADLELWREHRSTRYSFTKTALRLSQDGREIETTRGARVPVEVAERLWTVTNSCREHNKYWIPGVEFKVGPYRLTKVLADGTLLIGCHTIPFDELVLMAKKLKFIEGDSDGLEPNRIEVDGSVCGASQQASAGEHCPAV